MFKSAIKLAGLFMLLVLSFIYTDSVFDSARKNDPVMKEILNYKTKNDTLGVEPIIKNDEMIIGYSGIVVNEDESYKNMKNNNHFNENMLVFNDSLPKKSITKTYDYYIKKGNPSKKNVALIFKVKDSYTADTLLKYVAKNNIKINIFIDGEFLQQNISSAFSMVNLNCEIYNLGFNEKYQKNFIDTTNNLIESITLKDANFCLFENKKDEEKKLCSKKKMYSLLPSVINPSISQLKNSLDKGQMIAYDASLYDYTTFSLMINTIISRGYKIVGLSDLIKE